MSLSDGPPKAPEQRRWESPPAPMPVTHPRDMENLELKEKLNRSAAEKQALLRDIAELGKIITLLQNSGKVTADQVDAARSLLNA